MQQLIVNYGYLAIFVLMLAESARVPVPSEVRVLLCGAHPRRNHRNAFEVGRCGRRNSRRRRG